MSQNQLMQSSFDALCEIVSQRATELKQFERGMSLYRLDDEASSASPFYDSFLNSIGPNSIQKMTTFSPAKILHLHRQFEPFIAPLSYFERGKHSSF